MSGLPDLGRLFVWGLVAAVASMGLYRLTSNQSRLAANKEESAALQKKLADFDGPFSELRPLLGRNLALAGHRLWLSLVPALIASVPVIFIIAWVANAFDAQTPAPGEAIEVEAIASDGRQLPPLRWQGDGQVREEREGAWKVAWPTAAAPLQLLDSDGTVLLSLPTAAPAGRFISAGGGMLSSATLPGICPARRRGRRTPRHATTRVPAARSRVAARLDGLFLWRRDRSVVALEVPLAPALSRCGAAGSRSEAKGRSHAQARLLSGFARRHHRSAARAGGLARLQHRPPGSGRARAPRSRSSSEPRRSASAPGPNTRISPWPGSRPIPRMALSIGSMIGSPRPRSSSNPLRSQRQTVRSSTRSTLTMRIAPA